MAWLRSSRSPTDVSPDMEPGPGRPGITICTPLARDRQPEAAYWCRCGANERATGTGRVLALIDRWADHCEACSLAPEPRWRLTAHQASVAPGRSVNRQRRSEFAAPNGLWAA